jgi:hypothetical protein
LSIIRLPTTIKKALIKIMTNVKLRVSLVAIESLIPLFGNIFLFLEDA